MNGELCPVVVLRTTIGQPIQVDPELFEADYEAAVELTQRLATEGRP